MAEVGNCPIFVAENGNLVHISVDSDTKIVNETEISFSEGWKTEIVNIIVTESEIIGPRNPPPSEPVSAGKVETSVGKWVKLPLGVCQYVVLDA